MIRKAYLFQLLPILATGLLLWGCGDDSAPGATVLKIVATGNVLGEIEPCG
jgi:hypothetical protein